MESIEDNSYQEPAISSDENQSDQFSGSEEDENEEAEEEIEDGEVEFSHVTNINDSEYKPDDESQDVTTNTLASTSGLFTPVTTDILTGSTSTLQMALPLASIGTSLGSGQELVIIAPNGGIMKFPDSLQAKAALTAFSSMEDDEPETKRILVEQDGQTYTYILTVQGALGGIASNSGLDLTQTTVPVISPAAEMPILMSQDADETNATTTDINQAWFTSREDKSNLHSKGHNWKQGMWSKEEIELLEANILMYCEERGVSDPALVIFEMTKDERKDFYRSVAKGLNRPLFSVYRRVIRMYDNKNHVGKYTSEELEKLKKLRAVYGNDWQSIGSALGRSASSIKDRCRLMKDNCNQGKWFPEEERRLAEAVYELAQAVPGEMISSGLSWALVAERVSTRSEKQCRTKWLNYLNWKEAQGTEWTREDDITLICSVRSPQWLRGKWWALKRHVPNSNDCPFQEVCEYLFRHQVQNIRVKDDENVSSPSSARALPLNILRRNSQTLLTRPLSSPTPNISPQQQGICSASNNYTALIPTLTTSMTGSLLGDLSGVQGSPLVTTTGGTPFLQTVKVLGPTHQGLHLTTTNHSGPQTTFLLTQPSIPITTPNGQIIIQTLTPEELHMNEGMSVQLANPSNTQLIISSGGHSLGTLGNPETHLGTIGGSPSPSRLQVDELQESQNGHPHHHVALLDHVAYIHHNHHHHSHSIEEEEKSLIMADPMLAASHSPEMLNSEIESREESES